MARWTARQSYKHPDSWRVDDEAFIKVATVDDYHRDPGENERLAYLIAACPDLLAACRLFERWDADPHATEADASTLRKAIAGAIARTTRP